MLRRILALVLVPLMLANQGLGLAHVHGNESAAPQRHGVRPHIHIGGHVPHDRAHGHQDAGHQHAGHSHSNHLNDVAQSEAHKALVLPACMPLGDHDSDAAYCGDSTHFALRVGSVRNLVEKDFTSSAVLHVASHSDRLLALGLRGSQPPLIFGSACPIYLRTLSLRI